MSGPLTVEERVEVEAELAATLASRARMVDARAANPHLDHWKLPGQLAAIDRHVARMEALLAGPTVEAAA